MTEWKIDRWKYYDIIHRFHKVCNPMSVEKLDELCRLLDLSPGAQVLDVACGKGEMLVMLAERSEIKGVGVDISPYAIADAEKKRGERVPRTALRFITLGGADYRPDEPESFDLTMCIGASWVFEGHRGTLRALKDMTKPGGLVMVGEPYWLEEPSQDYLDASGDAEGDFGTHYGNVTTGEEVGLTFLYSAASSHDDWDRYEGLHWLATADYARSNSDDPDLPEIEGRVSRSRQTYLRWGRDTLGWAIYLFRKPG